MITRKIWSTLVILFAVFLTTCKKEEVAGDKIGNNNSPYYDGIPTVLVQNYVNRLFIDLIGREPLDDEMDEEVEKLKIARYNPLSRDSLIDKLQKDETFKPGDSSFKIAYFNRLYELFKVKMLEGASDKDVRYEIGLLDGAIVRDSIAGDWFNFQLHKSMVDKLNDVLAIDEEYRDSIIDIKDAFGRLLDNAVYDRINMNTFNFINASYNDLFGRYPTTMEFDNAFEIIEYNNPSTVFGKSASNKDEYINVLVNSQEFYEGVIRWVYVTLLSREPEAQELEEAMNTFYYDHDLPRLQKTILRTDEYANFIQ